MLDTRVSGMMIYYYFVCKRKLWYFCHEIQMENDNENVKMGKILDETAYKREEKHICINNEINIDYIQKENILHEIKKSRGIEDASIWQLKYYIYYLDQRGVVEVKGRIDYPLLKKTLNVECSMEDKKKIEDIIAQIRIIINQENPPQMIKFNICKKCAYHDLCFI